jgi:hypothetical protein
VPRDPAMSGRLAKQMAAELGIHAALAQVADEPLRIRLLGNLRFPLFPKKHLNEANQIGTKIPGAI